MRKSPWHELDLLMPDDNGVLYLNEGAPLGHLVRVSEFHAAADESKKLLRVWEEDIQQHNAQAEVRDKSWPHTCRIGDKLRFEINQDLEISTRLGTQLGQAERKLGCKNRMVWKHANRTFEGTYLERVGEPWNIGTIVMTRTS